MSWWEGPVDRALRRLGIRRSHTPREPVSLRPIGVVRNQVWEPQPDGWERVRSDIHLLRELTDALDGIDSYSHLIVVFACHRVPDDARATGRIRPRGDPSLPEQGVLATRSQLRPNPIAVSVVPLVRRRNNVLRVMGLDAIDGSPVLDVKPYIPQRDSIPNARVPDWLARRFEEAEPSLPTQPPTLT